MRIDSHPLSIALLSSRRVVSSSETVVDLTREFPVIGNISTSQLVDGLCYSHPAPGIALRQGNPGASPNAKVHPTVKNYVWLAEGVGSFTVACSNRRSIRLSPSARRGPEIKV